MKENLDKILLSKKMLTDKEHKILFLTPDTKGIQRAAIEQIYIHARTLRNAGYNAIILHEKNDYNMPEWIGEWVKEMPHESIEAKKLKVSPQDFLIIPELFGNVIAQTKELPCKRIVFAQSYDYILDMLQPGMGWVRHGITDYITTSEKQKEMIETFMLNVKGKITPVGIDTTLFKSSATPKKPLIGIHCRDGRDAGKIVKQFYLKYPFYRWTTFVDLISMSKEDFATQMESLAMVIWVDDISGFGTLPLEAMAAKAVVVGKVPNLEPEWLTEQNGIWTYDFNKLPDIIAEVFKHWLEDTIPDETYVAMEETVAKYSDLAKIEQTILNVYQEFFTEREKEFDTTIKNLETKIKQQEEEINGSK